MHGLVCVYFGPRGKALLTGVTMLIEIGHDGNCQEGAGWRPGRGLNGMEMRCKELGGRIRWLPAIRRVISGVPGDGTEHLLRPGRPP